MRRLRFRRPDLDFHIDVVIHEHEGRYLATADLGEDSRDVGTGASAEEALRGAQASLGELWASELA